MKEKIQKVLWAAGLVAAGAFCLLQIELQGYHDATNLLEQMFEQPVDQVEVTVPHPKSSVENLIRWTFGKDTQMALAISQAENGSRKCDRVSKPNKDGSIDIGLFQVNNLAHRGKASEAELKDCLTNIQVAKQIFDKSGWNPWTVFKTGAYKKYL